MNLVFIVVLLFSSCFEFSFCSDVCPKQCDCDTDKGLNRAVCVDQNIVTVDIGVPKQVQVYSLNNNGITELDNFCFKVKYILTDDSYLFILMNDKTIISKLALNFSRNPATHQ